MAIPKNNEMRFEVTNRCNYNCIICPHDKITRDIGTIEFDLFKKIFDKVMSETGQYNILTFSGMGESLLDKELDQKIEYVKKQKKDMSVLILTNASLLSVSRFRQLQALGVDSIRVSFYGNDPESYSKMHGIDNKELFSRIRGNLVKISQTKSTTKLLLTLNVFDVKIKDYTREWIKFWRDKADLVEVWRPHNWGDGKNYRTLQKEKLKTCGRPFKGPLQVQVDGTVNMCCFDFDGKLVIGDLNTQSLEDIFSSAEYKKIVKHHQSGDFTGSDLICENCDQRNKDKSDVMIYNSKFSIKERVSQLSTSYKKIS